MSQNASDKIQLQNDAYIYKILLAQAPILIISGLLGAGMLTFTVIAAIALVVLVQIAYSVLKGTSLLVLWPLC